MKKIILTVAFVLALILPSHSYAAVEPTCPAGQTYTCDDANVCLCKTDVTTSGPGAGGSPTDTSGTQSGFTALAPIDGLTDSSNTSVVNADSLANFFNRLYKYLIGLAAVLAIIQIIWAGMDIAIFHKDAVSAITDDKGKIYNAVLGLVLVLSPVLVFSIINPSILNLSINLKPITFVPQTYSPTNGTGVATTTAATLKCDISRSNGDVACPNQEAAITWAQESCKALTGQEGYIYLTSDPKYPYGASCYKLAPGQPASYTNKTDIPRDYYCYAKNVRNGSTVSILYTCGINMNSCTSLAMDDIRAGAQTLNGGNCVAAPNL